MTKRSGFQVKIRAFIAADPKNTMSMSVATDAIIALQGVLQEHHMVAIGIESRFMLKDIPDEPVSAFPEPDEPKAAQAVPPNLILPVAPADGAHTSVTNSNFDGPEFMDHSKRKRT